MNWPQIIADIQAHGHMNQSQIAARVGCARATICELATGVTSGPRYVLGSKLVDLLYEVTGTPQPEEP